ncbi:apolipoprotein C-I precursor [Salmo salar]|uniref:Apolipoprotein C-I n=2 Tax=Salmo salar TaxID=8030 RepID=B5XE16_SALSA|nr:apolipoprotein C-I precursor [Salmo salar]ACI69086.1 Apolipoprotein C-I precursor [Salmo salar]|eukprot:NP_001134834.1 Apolipoprotein C-I precursor [Salmo salar]
MKLSIAIAVLMLVFAAHTEAQESEKTIEERFTTFSNQMKELTDDLTVKTKDMFEKIGDSEFAIKTKTWFTEQLDKMKAKVDETFPKQQ